MFEISTRGDRTMKAKVAFVLAVVICIAVLSIWNFVSMLAQPGRMPRPSLTLVLIAILCVAGIFHYKEMLLRLAFAMEGTQSAVRAFLWLAGAPRGWQSLAALAGKILTAAAAIIVIFVIVEWFNSAARQPLSSDIENPTP